MKFGSKSHIALLTVLWILALAACSRVAGPAVISMVDSDEHAKPMTIASKSRPQGELAQAEIDAAAAALDGLLEVTVNDAEQSFSSVALLGEDGRLGALSTVEGTEFNYPLPGDAFAQTAISGDKGDMVNFLTQMEIDQIVSFYGKVMPAHGWRLLPEEGSISAPRAVRFSHPDGQRLKLTFLGDEVLGIGATMVVIESTR
jgi:hypothetical protein